MDDKSVKIITFSGKKADWKFWSKKFCSYVHIKGGEPVWDAKPEDIPKESEVIDISNDDGKAKAKLKSLNKSMMGLLNLCLSNGTDEEEKAFDIVTLAADSDTDYKLGNFPKIWKCLQEEYEPINVDEIEAMIDKYHNLKLKGGEDPTIYVARADTMRVRLSAMGITKSDEEHMLHCMRKLPVKTYHECQKDIKKLYDQAKEDQKDVPTLSKALTMMQAHHRYLNLKIVMIMKRNMLFKLDMVTRSNSKASVTNVENGVTKAQTVVNRAQMEVGLTPKLEVVETNPNLLEIVITVENKATKNSNALRRSEKKVKVHTLQLVVKFCSQLWNVGIAPQMMTRLSLLIILINMLKNGKFLMLSLMIGNKMTLKLILVPMKMT